VVHQERYDATLTGVPAEVGTGYVSRVLFRCKCLMSTTMGSLMMERATCITWLPLFKFAEKVELYLIRLLLPCVVALLVAGPFVEPYFQPANLIRDIALLVGVAGAGLLQAILILTYLLLDEGFKMIWPLALVIKVPTDAISLTNDFLKISKQDQFGYACQLDWDQTVLGIVQKDLQSFTVMLYTDEYVLHSHRLLHEFFVVSFFHVVAIIHWRLFGIPDYAHWFTNVDLVIGLAGIVALYVVFFAVKAACLLANGLLCHIPSLIVSKIFSCRRAIFIRSLIRNTTTLSPPAY